MGEIRTPYVAGFFDDPHEFAVAAEASTARGHKHHDAYMPYPVHGFDASLGLRRSWIGRVVLAVLLGGAFLGFMMQYWMMKVDWPIIIAGKPYNSWPAFVVITFEAGILSGAIVNFLTCLLVACRLYPRAETPVVKRACTDDLFALCIPVAENGTPEDLRRFLVDQGARDVALYEARPAPRPAPAHGAAEAGHA